MRFKPLIVFYLLVIILFAFDATMWVRHQRLMKLAREISSSAQQLSSLYKENQISPIERSIRIRTNATHEQIKHLYKPWPIPDFYWNQILLKAVFLFLIPVLMVLMLWLHFRKHGVQTKDI